MNPLRHLDRCNYDLIPAHMMASLLAYTDPNKRQPVGDFLRAVLCNNFKEACARADVVNLCILPVYATWLYNEAPAACWGSLSKVDAWLCFADRVGQPPEQSLTGLDDVTDVAEMIGGQVYRGYSGRFMFGKKCLGIVCSPDDGGRVIGEMLNRGHTRVGSDDMGTYRIVYWPDLEDPQP